MGVRARGHGSRLIAHHDRVGKAVAEALVSLAVRDQDRPDPEEVDEAKHVSHRGGPEAGAPSVLARHVDADDRLPDRLTPLPLREPEVVEPRREQREEDQADDYRLVLVGLLRDVRRDLANADEPHQVVQEGSERPLPEPGVRDPKSTYLVHGVRWSSISLREAMDSGRS